MKRFLLIFLLLCTFSVWGQQAPPSFADSHLFYGSVQGITETGATLRARIGIREFSTPILNGQYGYSPVLEVKGRSGDTIKFFVVSSSGLDSKEVGQATYQEGGVTKLDFNHERGTATAGEAPPVPPPENVPPGSTLPAANETNTTGLPPLPPPVPPPEVPVQQTPPSQVQQPVQTPPAQQQQQVCSPGQRRCSGIVLQQCSFDGLRWDTLQTCTNGCDSTTLSCSQAVQPEIQQPQQEASSMMPLVGGMGLLFVIVVIVFFILYSRKKYAPLREYITQARGKGYSDQQIKTSLVANGWDPTKVEKYLK